MKLKIIMFALVVIALSSSISMAIGPEDIWYKGENTSDNGTLGLNLTAGPTTAYQPGKLGNAFYFDGTTNSVLHHLSDSNYDLGTEFSISFWVYTGTDTNYIMPISREDTGGWQVELQPTASGGSVKFYQAGYSAEGVTNVRNTTWNLIIVQREADGKTHIYINNILDVETTDAKTYNVAKDFHVGAGRGGILYQMMLGSMIDDIRIYTSVSLNSTHRSTLWNNGTGYNYSLNYSGTTPPEPIVISIILPTNTTYTTDYHNSTINASVNISGNSSSYSCNFTLDNITQYAPEMSNNTVANFTMVNVTAGNHIFMGKCNTTVDNRTANVSFSVLYDSELFLNSSNGWSLYEGQATTLSCSGISTTNLSINTIRVTNPFSLTGTSGIYIVDCDVANPTNFTNTHISQNLVVNKYVACFNQSTYGFEINFTGLVTNTTFNFTNLVNASLIRSDLGDVWIDGLNASNITINTTDGYYLNVNHTGLTSLKIRFTNYGVHNTYSGAARFSNLRNISNYTQVYPVVSLRLVDEINETNSYPVNSTVTAVLECPRGENFVELNSTQTQYAFSGLNYFSRAAVIVKYSSTIYYSRQRYILNDSGINYIDFYIVDAYQYALDRIDFKMLDSSRYGSLLRVYKNFGNQTKIINEGYFDASHFNSVYLIEDLTYYIQTILSGSITEFGTIVVTSAGEKDLSKTVLELNPNALLIADYITMNAYNYSSLGTQYLRVIYDDTYHGTNQVNITVYDENGTIFQNIQYNNTDSVDVEYNISSYANQSFRVNYAIDHDIFGNSPVEYMVAVITGSPVLPGLPQIFKTLASLFITLSIGGLTSRRTIVGGSILAFIGIIFFWGIGWLPIDPVAIVFIAVLLVLGVIYYFKIGGS